MVYNYLTHNNLKWMVTIILPFTNMSKVTPKTSRLSRVEYSNTDRWHSSELCFLAAIERQ